jgi:hypothetical protein
MPCSTAWKSSRLAPRPAAMGDDPAAGVLERNLKAFEGRFGGVYSFCRLVRHGLSLAVRCDAACTIRAALRVRIGRTARRRVRHAKHLTLRVNVTQGGATAATSRRLSVRP